MFDWVLNTPMQTDTLVNMWKENIGSLQSARCNKVWNRIKGKVNKVGLIKSLLHCKSKIRNSKEAYKRAKEKQIEGSPVFPTYTELTRCWDIEMSWKSRSSNKLELIIEKLKQTTTMNRQRLMKNGKIEKLEKT